MSQLEAIARLPRGWDSHGAEPLDRAKIGSAAELLRALAAAEPSLPKPRIDPTPSGGVQLAWESPRRYFEIELVEMDLARYYFLDRDTHEELEADLDIGGWKRLESLRGQAAKWDNIDGLILRNIDRFLLERQKTQ